MNVGCSPAQYMDSNENLGCTVSVTGREAELEALCLHGERSWLRQVKKTQWPLKVAKGGSGPARQFSLNIVR